MTRWTVRKDPGRVLPWWAWQPSHRAATEHGFSSQRAAFAYALIHADPQAVVIR